MSLDLCVRRALLSWIFLIWLGRTSLENPNRCLSPGRPASPRYSRIPELRDRSALRQLRGSRRQIRHDIDAIDEVQAPRPRPLRLRGQENPTQEDEDGDFGAHGR